MRVVLLVLLLANLAFYGAVHGWLGERPRAAVVPEEREPARLDQQIAPGRAVLLLPAADGAAREPAAAPTTTTPAPMAPPATSSAPEAQASSPTAPPPPAAVTSLPSSACLELAGLTIDDARRTAERVSSERLATEAMVKPAAGVSTWMVYLPAFPSRPEAEKAATELRRKGVDDFFVIQDNSDLRNAISLGVYSSTDGAASRIAALTARGVKGAKTLARTNGVARARVEIRQVRESAQAALAQIAKEFPGGEWQACQPVRKG